MSNNIAKNSDSSEDKPIDPSTSSKIADIMLKVLMGGGIIAGGSGAFWSLLVQSDIPKAIASAVIGLGISYGAKLLQPVHKGTERRLEAAGKVYSCWQKISKRMMFQMCCDIMQNSCVDKALIN